MPYREFGKHPESGYPTESQLYPPGAERSALMAKFPTDKRGTAKWEIEFGSNAEWLVTYLDGKEISRRRFTNAPQLMQMKKIVLSSLPAGRAVAVWWDIKEGDEIEGRNVALVTGVIADATAPKVVTDGLDAMEMPELLTKAGMMGLKEANGIVIGKRTPKHVLIDMIRNKLKEKTHESVTA